MRALGNTNRRTVAGLTVVALTTLAACAEADPGVGSTPPTTHWKDCGADAFAAAGGQVADVETAAGERIVLKLPAEGPCRGGLVARVGAGVRGLDVSGLDLDADSARVVRLGSGDVLLRVDGGAHPRGGFQPHLFAVAAPVAEVLLGGRPLLPFVATDGGAAPMTADCGPGATVRLLTATTSKPPGVVLAWDVHRTTYTLDGGAAEQTGTRQIRDHAADPLLRDEMPALFRPGALLEEC